MGCNCGKPKCNGKCGISPSVLQINNNDCTLFHRVNVPASMGDDTAYPPKNGLYKNVLLYYEANEEAYLYSSDGIPTKVTGGIKDYNVLENKPKINGVELSGDKTLTDLGITTAIDDAVNAEAAIREGADEDIWDEIELIEIASDVVDIVGTYADLQNYDTSKLQDNDIIKVLADETKSGATTYYRWNKTSQTFAYIGEEGPYYTQTQVNTLLGAKQDTLTAGTNISIDASNVISAVDTTYSDFVGTDGVTAGSAGLVPGPLTTDADKFLKSDGTWSTTPMTPVDNALSWTSTNPVENQVIRNAIYAKNSGDNKEAGVDIGYVDPVAQPYVAIGAASTGNKGANSVAVGAGSSASSNNIAIGRDAAANTGVEEILIGSFSDVGPYGTTVGHYAHTVGGNNNVAIGEGAQTRLTAHGTSVGSLAQIYEGDGSVALGYASGVIDGATESVAIGDGAHVEGNNTVGDITSSVALGAGSVATESDVVVVGHAGNGDDIPPYYRRISFVADATAAHDAVTKGQLDSATAVMGGATSSVAGTRGLVPAPAAGDQGKYLKGDGTWGEIQIPQVRTTLYLFNDIPDLPASFDIYKDELCTDPITWDELYDLLDSDTGMDVVLRVVSSKDAVFNIVSYEHRTGRFGVIDASDEYSSPASYLFQEDYDHMSTRSGFVVEKQEFGGGLTELSYGNSTWSDFITAYQAGKIVYCRASSNSNPATGAQGRKAFMAYVNNATTPTEVEFQYVRSVSSKTAAQPVDQVYVYKLTNAGVWTVETRNMAPKLAQGTGTTVSYSNGTYTISAAVPTVVQTTGQSTTDVMSQKAVTDIIGNVETILQTLNSGNGAQ